MKAKSGQVFVAQRKPDGVPLKGRGRHMHAKRVPSPHLEWDRRHICANRVLSQRADVSSIVPQRTRMNQPVTE